MKKLFITLIILILVVGGAAAGAYYYRSSKKNSNPVKVYPVSGFVGNWYENTQSFNGNIVVSEEQNIYIENDKILKEIYASPGDSVKVGEVILEYDSTQESLKLSSMEAQLDVTYTNLKLAENQLAKLNNVTPIEDGAEIPKTEAEKKLEEAEKALDAAGEKVIAPYTELNLAKEYEDNCKTEMNEKEKELNDAVKIKADEDKKLNDFYKKNKIATMTDATPEAKPRTTEEIEKDVAGLDKVQSNEYYKLAGANERAGSTVEEKQKELSEITEKYNAAILDSANKEKIYDEAQQEVDKAQKAVEEAEAAVLKEQEEQLENPTIIYTKSELAKAIRLKNEEIKDLNLSIENQKLAIRRQEKAIDKLKVCSELDGVVRFNDQVDDMMSGAVPAIIINATGTYSAVVNVDELSLEELAVGDEVSLLSYDTGNSYIGKVSKVAENPSEDRGGYEYTASSYPVTIVIEDGDDLSEGMWVEATPSGAETSEEFRNQIVLPLALCKKENATYYVMKEVDGRLKKQYISTGKIYYGQQIVVKSGLSTSDHIAFPYEKDAVEGKVCKEADLNDIYGY